MAAARTNTKPYVDGTRASAANPFASQSERPRCEARLRVTGYQAFELSSAGPGQLEVSNFSEKGRLVAGLLEELRASGMFASPASEAMRADGAPSEAMRAEEPREAAAAAAAALPAPQLLDLGCNGGLMLCLGARAGLVRLCGVEHDTEYVAVASRALDFCRAALPAVAGSVLPLHLEPEREKAEGEGGGAAPSLAAPPRADVVLALALVHWLVCCTASFGSLDAIVHRISALARRAAIIEWIDPSDPAVQGFRHTRGREEGYTRAAFEAALGRHFARFRKGPHVNPTRVLYMAFRE